MPRIARRQAVDHIDSEQSLANSAIVLTRLLKLQSVDEDSRSDVELAIESRRNVFKLAIAAQRKATSFYESAYKRREAWFQELIEQCSRLDGQANCPSPLVEKFLLATPPGMRLVIGLGAESPLETGLTLHPLYGVPIIPGAAIKGLAAHYCRTVFGQLPNQQELGPTGCQYRLLFGDTDEAGFFTFHDAWMDPKSLSQSDEGLLWDVMTPHHGDYYSRRSYQSGPTRGQAVPPTDFDDPNPVSFLSVRGRFQFFISCAGATPEAKNWLTWAKSLVMEALADWGVGGKTASGYGRLELPPPPPPPNLRSGQVIEVELLAERTNRGGWRVKIVGTEVAGAVVNSADVPQESKPGQRFHMKVVSANVNNASFRYG